LFRTLLSTLLWFPFKVFLFRNETTRITNGENFMILDLEKNGNTSVRQNVVTSCTVNTTCKLKQNHKV